MHLKATLRNGFFLGTALVGSFAYGSHTVCSSPTLYYSSTRIDSGVAPLPGTEVGTLTIVAKGKVLVSETHVQGSYQLSTERYAIGFQGPRTVLATTGGEVAGTTVFTDHAVLRRVGRRPEAVVERSAVVCETAWAMVPSLSSN